MFQTTNQLLFVPNPKKTNPVRNPLLMTSPQRPCPGLQGGSITHPGKPRGVRPGPEKTSDRRCTTRGFPYHYSIIVQQIDNIWQPYIISKFSSGWISPPLHHMHAGSSLQASEKGQKFINARKLWRHLLTWNILFAQTLGFRPLFITMHCKYQRFGRILWVQNHSQNQVPFSSSTPRPEIRGETAEMTCFQGSLTWTCRISRKSSWRSRAASSTG